MNPPVIPAVAPRPGPRFRLLPILAIVFLFALLSLVGLAVGLSGYFRLSREARVLRNSLMQSTAAKWDRQIELSVGSWTVNLVRAGLGFVHLDPEARAGLRAIRGAEVGVYRLSGNQPHPERAAVLPACDAAMAARGWDRMVAVVQQRELVAVYVPRRTASPRDVRVCLVVLNGRDLVVASARSNLEPLLELAANQLDARQQAGRGAALGALRITTTHPPGARHLAQKKD